MTPSFTFAFKCQKNKISALIWIRSYLTQSLFFSLFLTFQMSCGYQIINSQKLKAVPTNFENRTPFPSLSVHLKTLWRTDQTRCLAEHVTLKLSNPLRFSQTLPVEQSILTLHLKLINGDEYKDSEIVSYSSSLLLTEEQLLGQLTVRLAKRMYDRCRSDSENL